MTLTQLIKWAKNKNKFNNIEDYASFCQAYLEFILNGLQAVIVSQNENHYHFFQYQSDGHFNVSRPINSNLMITSGNFDKEKEKLVTEIASLKTEILELNKVKI